MLTLDIWNEKECIPLLSPAALEQSFKPIFFTSFITTVKRVLQPDPSGKSAPIYKSPATKHRNTSHRC